MPRVDRKRWAHSPSCSVAFRIEATYNKKKDAVSIPIKDVTHTFMCVVFHPMSHRIEQVAQAFVVTSEDAKELSSALKEYKTELIDYFENHGDVEQIGKVRCQRTAKKGAVNQKKFLEIVKEEIMRTPATTGADLMENINTRMETSKNEPGEPQIKLSIIGEKKPRKK